MIRETVAREDVDELSPEQREFFERLLAEDDVELEEPEPILRHPRSEGTGAVPLSFAQQRLWILYQLDPASPAYNVPAALRLAGPLDAGALARSLREVVRRHEVLRTAIRTVDGRPVAEAAGGDLPLPLPVVDLSGLGAAARLGEAHALAGREALQPFDIARAPLLRATLVVLAPAEYLALLTMHHIVSDGWSVGVLVREMGALYAAFRQGRPSPLPPLPVQYADFAAWQRQRLTGELLARQLAYWRGQLAGAPPVITLPSDRPRPAVPSRRGSLRPLRLPPRLGEAVDLLGLQAGATPFMTLTAAVAAWLHRHGAGEDLVVGSPIANRTRTEVEGLIGFFVNTVVLRADLGGNPSWLDLLERVRAVTLGAYENQDLPFERLVEELAVARDTSYNPLFQVMVALQNAPLSSALSLAGLTIGHWEVEATTARFDLVVDLREEPRWQGSVEYAADLFDAASIDRMIGHFERLVAAAVEAPGRPLAELPLLSGAERHQLTVEWGDGALAAPVATLPGLFAAQAARTPDAVAVSGPDGELTYGGLDTRANRLARRLRRLGVGPEVPVAICVERSLEMVVGLLGILKAGGIYVPLDPGYPKERLKVILEDTFATAASPVLLLQDALRGAVPAPAADAAGPLSRLRVLRLDADWEAIAHENGAGWRSEALPENLAYVIFTSGSTGRPKGVQVTHANATRLLAATRHWFGFQPADVWTLFHSYAFDFSVWEIWGALLTGGRLVVVPYWVSRSPEELYDLLAREQVTVLNQTPSSFHQVAAVEESPAGAVREGELALRWVIFGGEALEPRRLAGWFARHGDRRPTLVNMYGITETTVHVTFRPLGQGDLDRGSVIGAPIPDLYVQVLDSGREPAPVGVAGEIHVGGAGLARGYLGRPALTAERFVPDPFAPWPGARLYASGDLARRRPDGELEYLGRADQQVKIRGFRIEPGEIEAALASLAGVREAVVVVREDAPGDRRLVAYVAGDVACLEPGTLRRSLQERLPDHMVPAAFVTLPTLPLTAHGKVDRKALPAPERQGSEERYLAPRTPAEEILAGIWAELLAVDRVGAADHFFDLGGHSLLATQVMSRVRGAFGVEMPLRDLFEAPVLADLAARVAAALRDGAGSAAPPLVPLAPALREGLLPLSFAQQRLWFVDQLEPGSPLYNIPVALRLEGPLSPAVLAGSLGEIVRRHETLRTVFAAVEGEPVQVIRPASPVGLPLVDLSGLPEGDREAAAAALAADEAGRPFDLARGPLLRGLLLRLSGGEHVAALTVHHIVSDGWSMGILVREVTALYAALAAGRPSPLAEPPVQYADFAVWQRSWLRGATLESEIAFWRRQLAGLPSRLELPTDRARPAVQSFRGASRPLRLPAALTRQAEALARRQGATLFMVLLAGFQALLARYSGQDDLAVGTPVAGRNRIETEELIGFFVNTLVMRGDLSGEPSFRELLGRVRETALAAHMHQDVSFEKLVQELSPERSLGRSPLFQVMLALQDDPAEDLEIRDLRLRPVGGAATTAKFDVTLRLVADRDGLSGAVEYAAHLFDAATVDRLIVHYERLLTAALAAPELRAAELPLLGAAERQQLRVEWCDSLPALPPGPGLPERFFAAADQRPEAVALHLGESALTYGELARRVRRRAALLRSRGVGPETVTALCFDRSFEMVEAVLAVLAAGGAFVALDPRSPGRVLAALLDEAAPGLLLTRPDLLARLPARSGMPALLMGGEDRNGGGGEDLPRSAAPGSLAYVAFTSGSTGAPKGILGTRGAMAGYLDYLDGQWPLSPADRVLQLARLSFDASIRDLLYPLTRGAGVTLLSDDEARDPAAMLRKAREQGVTCLLSVVPSQLRALVEAAGPLEGGGALRLVLASGEPLPAALCRQVRDAFGDSVRIVNQYGPTECTMTSTLQRVAPDDPAAAVVPAGRPIPGMRCRVLDRRLQEVPAGVAGQVFLGGAGLTRGYLNRPDLTAEKFLPDPFAAAPGMRLYATGDLGRQRADGSLELLGRIDHQVKLRGIRIEPGEIEAALSALAGVREAVVVAREDVPGDPRLVAYVAGDAAAETLRRSLRERLPEAMVPAVFVTLAALPLTPNGKVDRKALPAPERPRAGEERLAPRTPVEEVLAGIWAELLGVERVGADGHFFDLGGHSLLATRVMSRLRSALGVELPLRDLFEAPTLAGLAARVEAARQTGLRRLAPPLTRIAPALREGGLPLSFAQQRLWFIDQLEPGSPLYNIRVALRAAGPLDPGVLALCLGEIARRHEVLRTVFAARKGGPVQVVQPAAPFALAVVDLSDLPAGGREATALALAGEEAGRAFDLARGPLLRGVLLRLAEGEHIAALALHHIASDGWSMGILVREVAALYAAFAAGRPSPLPELPVQYADFAVWQHGWLDQEALAGLVEYWRQRLAGAPPQLDLPGARPRPAVLSPRGAACRRRFPRSLLEQLRALVRRESATLFMALLASLQALLYSRSGATDLVVGTDVAGRDGREVEELIGFFINQLPLRADLTGDPTLRELLGRVRETALEAYAHQDVPFDHLVEALRVERSVRRSPVFQVKLVLQNAPWERLELPGLTLTAVPLSTETAQLDLHWNFAERDEELWLTLAYSTDLYDEPWIEGLLDQYEIWLHAFTERPGARLGEVAAELAQAERARRAERGRELKSQGFGKLRSLRRQADSPMEV